MSDQSPLTQRDVEALRTTLHSLDRTIQRFQDTVDRTYARKDVIEPQLITMRRDIDGAVGWITWAQRVVLGALLLAAVGLLIYSGAKGGK